MKDIDTYSCSPGILGAGTTTPLDTGLFTGDGALLGGNVAVVEILEPITKS